MVGSYANGIYNASYKLISVLTVFSTIYTAIFFPVMSKFFKNEKNLLKVSFEKSVKYLMMIMIPLAFATVLYSTDIVQLIYGHEYDPAHTVLSILIWTVCLLFVNSACTNLLNASHKEKLVTVVYMAAAIFNIVLNLYMIPNYSYDGAAVSTVLSDLLILILFLVMIARIGQLPDKKLVFDLIKIIVGSVVLYGILSFLGISMWLAIPVGIIIYLLCLIVLKTFDKEDIYIVKEVLGKN
jgi:O-antigen/teichoic acid export membrane protein